MQANTLGFMENTTHDGEIDINNFFSPEFRNRLDAVLRFKALKKEVMVDIVEKFVKELNKQMESKRIKIKLDDTAREQLIEEGFDSKMGARPLQRVINQRIKLPLSKKILFEGIFDESLTVVYSKDSNEFEIIK